MRLLIARHGQTRWNVENRVSGRTDIPLTEEGQKRALLLAENAEGKGIDVIIASPLLRAQETAKAVSDAIGVPILTDDRIIELDFGIYEGGSRFDPEFQFTRSQMPFRYPGGESAFDLAARVYGFLHEVRERYEGKTVLLVCHGAVCRMVRSYFVDMTNEEYGNYFAPNAQIEEYAL